MEVVPGRFFYLLRSAYEAHDQCDNYDVHSEVPESLEMFKQLSKEQLDQVIQLVDCVKQYGDDIKRVLTAGFEKLESKH